MDVHYVAFLLRLWKVGAGEGEGAIWRASLEHPHTGEIRAFGSLEALIAFLWDITCDEPDSQGDLGEGDKTLSLRRVS